MKFTQRMLMSIFASLTLGVPFAQASTLTVQPGDTLWKIAAQHNTTIPALVASNPSVSASNLQPGQNLQLPIAYLIRQGDTFWNVANSHHLSTSQLMAANPSVAASNLQVGTQLQVPAESSSASSTTSAQSTSASSSPATTTSAQSASASSSPAATSNQAASSGVSQSNINWLARLIHAEAGGESLQAQIAVGDVVWHRVQSGTYPSTVKGVIFQIDSGHYQFESVANGSIYNTPDASNTQAATDVLVNHEDVVPGALVFYNPAMTGAGSWVWNQPTVATIGHLTFAQ